MMFEEGSLGGALAGLRVLDLTQMLAGPYCTMLLADLGAEVVKVEPPAGDMTRQQAPFAPDDELKAYGGYFQSVNRNKSSVVVDLKHSGGKEVLKRLTAESDVLVENSRVGVMERLGLSYESLREVNPRLVYACIRGFGDPRTGESPYADWPAFDVVAQAMGGLMGITGPEPECPTKAGPGVGDIFPAALSSLGILAAVRHADRTGEGQMVDVAMYDGTLALCERIVHQYSYTGKAPGPQGNTHPLLCPFDVFPAADGWITIAAPGEGHWRQLCAAMNRPELGDDERYATNERRVERDGEVRKLVSDWTGQHPTQKIVAQLGGRVPCGPVNTAEAIFEDEHVAARKMLIELEHPGSAAHSIVAGTPIKMTETNHGTPRRAPLLGEHTDRILTKLGYSQETIDSLKEGKAVL